MRICVFRNVSAEAVEQALRQILKTTGRQRFGVLASGIGASYEQLEVGPEDAVVLVNGDGNVSDNVLLHDDRGQFARWLLAQRLTAENIAQMRAVVEQSGRRVEQEPEEWR